MGCYVRGDKNSMGCYVRGDKNSMGCFVRGGKSLWGVLSGVSKNGMGCFVPGCFVRLPQLLGLKSSTLPQSHCVPLCCLKKMQCSFINPVMSYGIASCFFFFFFFFFLQQIMLTLPRAVAHLSRVIRLPPSSMWHECTQRA